MSEGIQKPQDKPHEGRGGITKKGLIRDKAIAKMIYEGHIITDIMAKLGANTIIINRVARENGLKIQPHIGCRTKDRKRYKEAVQLELAREAKVQRKQKPEFTQEEIAKKAGTIPNTLIKWRAQYEQWNAQLLEQLQQNRYDRNPARIIRTIEQMREMYIGPVDWNELNKIEEIAKRIYAREQLHRTKIQKRFSFSTRT